MQSPCYRCGTPLEDQVPFCPSCRASQIRVAVPQEVPAAADHPVTPPLEPGTPASIEPPAVPVRFHAQPVIQWKKFVRMALPFAFVSGMVTALFAPLGFLVLAGSVVLCIKRYRRANPGSFTTGSGARMGAVTGLLSFPSYALLFSGIAATAPAMFREFMLRPIQQRAATDPQIQQVLQLVSSRSGFLALIIASMFMLLLVLLALAAITGAVTASLSNRGRGEFGAS